MKQQSGPYLRLSQKKITLPPSLSQGSPPSCDIGGKKGSERESTYMFYARVPRPPERNPVKEHSAPDLAV